MFRNDRQAGRWFQTSQCSAWRHWDDDLNWLWLSLAYCSVQFESPTITNQLVERDASHHTLLFPPYGSVSFEGVTGRPQIPWALCCGQGLGSPSCLWTTPTWPKSSAAAILWGAKRLTTRTWISMDINGYKLYIITHVVYTCDGHVRVMYVNVCYGPLMAFDDKDLSAEGFCIWILLYAFVATCGFTRPDSCCTCSGCCQWMLPSSARSKISYKYNHNFELL